MGLKPCSPPSPDSAFFCKLYRAGGGERGTHSRGHAPSGWAPRVSAPQILHPGCLARSPAPGRGRASSSHFLLLVTGLGMSRCPGWMSARGAQQGAWCEGKWRGIAGPREEEEIKTSEERRGPVKEGVPGPVISFPRTAFPESAGRASASAPEPQGDLDPLPLQQGWANETGMILEGASHGQVQAGNFLLTIQHFKVGSNRKILGCNR